MRQKVCSLEEFVEFGYFEVHQDPLWWCVASVSTCCLIPKAKLIVETSVMPGGFCDLLNWLTEDLDFVPHIFNHSWHLTNLDHLFYTILPNNENFLWLCIIVYYSSKILSNKSIWYGGTIKCKIWFVCNTCFTFEEAGLFFVFVEIDVLWLDTKL